MKQLLNYTMLFTTVLITLTLLTPVHTHACSIIFPQGGETFQSNYDTMSIMWSGEPIDAVTLKIIYTWWNADHTEHYFAYIDDDYPLEQYGYDWPIPLEIWGKESSGGQPYQWISTATTDGEIGVKFYNADDQLVAACNNAIGFTIIPYTNDLSLAFPQDGRDLMAPRPEFVWSGGEGPYYIQVADEADFSSIVWSKNNISGTSAQPEFDLPQFTQLWWRITDNSMTTPAWTFYRQGPPDLLQPDNGAVLEEGTIQFYWDSVNGATGYTILIDDNPQFTSPGGASTIYTDHEDLLTQGSWYWKVNAHTNNGDTSEWSETWYVYLTPAATPQPTNTPYHTPQPTNTPYNTPQPTNTPYNTPPPTNTPHVTPPPTPTPSGNERILGNFSVTADQFQTMQDGTLKAIGNVRINNLLAIDGELYLDLEHLSMWSGYVTITAINLPIVGTMALYSGELEIDCLQETFVNNLNHVVSMFAPAGLDFTIDSIAFELETDTAVYLRGRVELPGFLGGVTIDFQDGDYIELSLSQGLSFSGSIFVPQIFLGYGGWFLQNILIDIDPSAMCGGGQYKGLIIGSADLILPRVLTVEGEIDICDQYIEHVALSVSGAGIHIPLGTTGFFITAMGAEISNLMPGSPPMILRGTADVSGGSSITIPGYGNIYLILLDEIGLTVDLSGIVALDGSFAVFMPENPPWTIPVEMFGINLYEYSYDGISMLHTWAELNVNEGFSAGAELAIPESNPVIAAVADFNVDLDLNMTGNALGEIIIPPDAPILAGETIGGFEMGLTNDHFTGATQFGALELTATIHSNGAIELGSNLNLFDKKSFAEADTGGVDGWTTFAVPNGSGQAVVQVTWQSGDTDVILTNPNGVEYRPDNCPMSAADATYYKPVNGGTASYFIAEPVIGTWDVNLTTPGNVSGAELHVFTGGHSPSIALTSPDSDRVNPGQVTVTWNTAADNGTSVLEIIRSDRRDNPVGQVVYTEQTAGGQGSTIINTSQWPSGRYWLAGRLTHESLGLAQDFAAGQITIFDPSAPNIPLNVTAHGFGDHIAVSWNTPSGNPYGYVIDYRETGEPEHAARHVAVGDVTQYTLTDIEPGRDYVITVKSLSQDLRPSFESSPQTVRLTQTGGNRPWILSEPVRMARCGQVFTHTLTAMDFDQEQLMYQLVDAPAGMQIDSDGTITWTPGNGQIGNHTVTVRVLDDGNRDTTRSFTVHVVNTYGRNIAPQFQTYPPETYVAGEPWSYRAEATDPDADPVSYRLVSAPAGMTVNGDTGQINWSPVAGYCETVNVVLAAEDGHNGSVQTWQMGPWVGRNGVWLSINQSEFRNGDEMVVNMGLANAGETVDVTMYIALEVAGQFYFHDLLGTPPGFTPVPVGLNWTVPAGFDTHFEYMRLPFSMTLPEVRGAWWAIMMDRNTGNVFGDYAMAGFELM